MEIKYPKERERCPFYGFSGECAAMGFKTFTETRGNQCALLADSHSPCQMGYKGQTVDWDKCSLNDEERRGQLELMMDQFSVCPEELWPKGKASWDGIPLRVWLVYVMSQKEKVKLLKTD